MSRAEAIAWLREQEDFLANYLGSKGEWTRANDTRKWLDMLRVAGIYPPAPDARALELAASHAIASASADPDAPIKEHRDFAVAQTLRELRTHALAPPPADEAREWTHGCDALQTNITLWWPTVSACPMCGMPHDDRRVLAAEREQELPDPQDSVVDMQDGAPEQEKQ